MALSSGTPGRPPANAAFRGALLIVLAVVIGIAIMAWGFAEDGSLVATPDPDTTETADPTDSTEPTDPTDDPGTTEPDNGETTDPNDVAPPARDQSELTVLVLNGSGVNGAAGRVNDRLKPLNYITRSPDNASDRVEETRVFYVEGYRSEALRLAGELNIAEPETVVEVMPIPAPYGAELGDATSLLVVIGEDGLIAAAAP